MLRAFLFLVAAVPLIASPFCEIQVVDEQTGRGVPLVELETVHHVRFVTDSAGRVAVGEPGLMGEEVFFHFRSHGYEFPKDGFGYRGTRLKIEPGGKHRIPIKRLNIAERLYRTTGEGIHRDSMLLGYEAPIKEPLLNAQVVGQDSIQRVIYRGKIYWLWGDTSRLSYPLGNFRMSGAVSDLSQDPARGINLEYFTQENGFTKEMFPILPKGQLIWADGLMVVREGSDEKMVAHYLRLRGLDRPLARGLAIYNDETEEFEKWRDLELDEKWRFPHGHPIATRNNGVKYFQFGLNFPLVRARAQMAALEDPAAYEAFSCFADGSSIDDPRMLRDSDGKLVWRWTKDAPPVGAKEEKALIGKGLMKLDETRFQPLDRATGKVVQMHHGSVTWSSWRNKWILIATEIGGTSMLGEIWYSEADDPEGPWKAATKIVTHDQYSFYNPAHHPFLDQEGGRIIHFEGTYTAEFSGNQFPTQRYNYNQVMYRLDLADERLNPGPDRSRSQGSSSSLKR